jgi:polyisoprenoid-binding protein YceI
MKKMLLILFTSITGSFALAQYKPIDQGSSVQFVIKNLGFNVSGLLSGLDGMIQFDPGNLNVSSFDVSLVRIPSIQTIACAIVTYETTVTLM